ncbi:MAG: hypothetical protein ACWA5W_02980 [Phycisphaerales bacterium]
MIHSGHETSDVYSLDVLRNAIEEIDPDFVLCEIPPDRFEAARDEFAADGKISEPRVSRFPEYVDVLFPLTKTMDFEIVPCAGWTKAMSDDRNEKLDRWSTERPIDTAEVEMAQSQAEIQMANEGDINDPLFIHTDRYDELVKQALEPYNRLFNDDLGLGGWDNINAAHYGYIEAALDEHSGEGKTILITFGAWHKYWILEQLRQRDDIVIVDPKRYFKH